MKGKNDILDELHEISPLLASIEKKNIFTVPENYFSQLAERITVFNFLNQDQKSGTQNIQQVPEGYFNTLSDQIISKIRIEEFDDASVEFEKLFPVLNSIKDKNVLKVPAGYFDNLSENILKKVSQPAGKVVSISSAKSWWRYAAAAVVTAVIAISSFMIYNNVNTEKNNTPIIASNQLPDYIKTSFQYKTPQQLDEGIASLSADEIASYLEKNGSLMDNDLLLKNLDANKLPAETDYLSDENTLNNYLNSLGASTAGK